MSKTKIFVVLALAVNSIFVLLLLVHANSPEGRESGCNQGNALDCANLALRYESGAGVPKDEGRAFALYQKACAGQLGWACGSLGVFYAKGRTVPVDYGRALPLLMQGCDGALSTGCYTLGELYRDGHGVAVDLPRALVFFRRACSANTPHGRNMRASGHEAGCDEAAAVSARIAGAAAK